jgi:hypothetical protein
MSLNDNAAELAFSLNYDIFKETSVVGTIDCCAAPAPTPAQNIFGINSS